MRQTRTGSERPYRDARECALGGASVRSRRAARVDARSQSRPFVPLLYDAVSPERYRYNLGARVLTGAAHGAGAVPPTVRTGFGATKRTSRVSSAPVLTQST